MDGNIINGMSKILVARKREILKKVQEIADNLCERGNITNKGSGHIWNEYLLIDLKRRQYIIVSKTST